MYIAVGILILQTELLVRALVLPQGVLSGIGRKVSSLFFGWQPPEVQTLQRVVVSKGQEQECLALVLTTTNLQRWRLTPSTEEVTAE